MEGHRRLGRPATKTLLAPAVLGVTRSYIEDTVRYLGRIREEVVQGHRVVVDLRPCNFVSRAACLMLCAEIEVCRLLHPSSVSGYEPGSPQAQEMLKDLGFHKQLGHSNFSNGPTGPTSLIIHSGNDVGAQTASDLSEIADLARDRLPQSVVDAVLGTLQEAMINIDDHAYVGAPSHDRVKGKWWFAGALLSDGLAFVAYDHGVGISERALVEMPEALETYWQRRNRSLTKAPPVDVHILEAALGARREGIDVGGRGQGLPFMIKLIERTEARGRLFVVSGRAAARFECVQSLNAKLDMQELAYPLRGTLFAWQVSTRPGGSR